MLHFPPVAFVVVATGIALGNGVTRAEQPDMFRITRLELRDPHLFTLALGILCTDVTGSVNDLVESETSLDADGDGMVDQSFLVTFLPLDQSASCGAMVLANGRCTFPLDATTCYSNAHQNVKPTVYTNQVVETCLAVVPGTTSGYTPETTSSTAPCFSSETLDFLFVLGGAPVFLEDVTIGATYAGELAGSLFNGLMRGFLRETEADDTHFPASIPILGGLPVSAVLPGGTGNCASGDDRDLGPDGETWGWWLYLNFSAEPVPVACEEVGDFDVDCDTTLRDFATLQPCLAGPGIEPPACGCAFEDLDGSGDVDLRDVAVFQAIFTGAVE